MLPSILIILVSFVFLIYWFRYSCILLLRNREETVSVPAGTELDPLRSAIERDFRMLTYLWRHAADLGEQSLEDRLLVLDFKLMRLWYRVTRSAAPEQARKAISEMAAVVSILSRKMGEQAGIEPTRPASLM